MNKLPYRKFKQIYLQVPRLTLELIVITNKNKVKEILEK